MARTLVEYVAEDGRSPFARWFDALDSRAAAKVSTNLYRLEGENWSNVKSVGSGVFEQRVDFGPGYRIYFGQDGDVLVVLWAAAARRANERTSNRLRIVGPSTNAARDARGNPPWH